VPSADDISRSIEPGSTEYGDRQVVEDRIRQISAQAQAAPPPRDGARAQRTMDRMQTAPVSDAPITAGLSLGPGAGPSRQPVVAATSQTGLHQEHPEFVAIQAGGV